MVHSGLQDYRIYGTLGLCCPDPIILLLQENPEVIKEFTRKIKHDEFYFSCNCSREYYKGHPGAGKIKYDELHIF